MGTNNSTNNCGSCATDILDGVHPVSCPYAGTGQRIAKSLLGDLRSTIVCVRGNKHSGKSHVIKAVCNLLVHSHSFIATPINQCSTDILATLTKSGSPTKVGICSAGDIASYLWTSLDALDKQHCNLIICASGPLAQTVEQFATSNKYQLIYTSPYNFISVPPQSHNGGRKLTPEEAALKALAARHIECLIREIGFI